MVDYKHIFTEEAIDYASYRTLVQDLFESGKTTGEDHSEGMLQYTKLNIQRMNRVDKTVQLTAELKQKLEQLQQAYKFLIITEGWCGDAAQLVPVFNALTQNSTKLEMKLVLRDQHLDLIDAHLTNGGRAIPVVLVLDAEGNFIKKWGPRPVVLQLLLADWKAENPDMQVVSEKLHSWYAKDKTQTTQAEILDLLTSLEA